MRADKITVNGLFNPTERRRSATSSVLMSGSKRIIGNRSGSLFGRSRTSDSQTRQSGPTSSEPSYWTS